MAGMDSTETTVSLAMVGEGLTMSLTAGLATAIDMSSAVIGAGIALVTAAIVFALLIAVGFAIMVRRGRGARRSRGLTAADELATRADIALVRLDDAIAASTIELGYASAQFGENRAAALAASLATARASLASAFRLKQQLHDGVPDNATKIREWNGRIVLMCETSTEQLVAETEAFDHLRAREREAPDALQRTFRTIDVVESRLPGAVNMVQRLRHRFAPAAVVPVIGNATEAERLLDTARDHALNAQRLIASGDVAIDALELAAHDVRRAEQLLAELSRHSEALNNSAARLDSQVADSRALLEGARASRHTITNPASQSAIGEAISGVERALAAVRAEERRPDPDAARARLEASMDLLDTALAKASSLTEQHRHAALALAGALAGAISQIETTGAYIGGSRGSASAEARSRLAEARRLVTVAEAETDPVLALDIARSAATYARDADALARYDLLH